MKNEKGFTLLELITTMAIATILVMTAAPSMKSITMNSAQTGGINEMVAVMNLARNTAISTNSRVTICPSTNGAGCQAGSWADGWVAFTDADSDQIVDGGESVIRRGEGDDGLTISPSGFTSFIMYRPNGRAMGANVSTNTGEFSVCDSRGSDHAKVVIVDLSGRPRVDTKRASGAAPTCPVSS